MAPPLCRRKAHPPLPPPRKLQTAGPCKQERRFASASLPLGFRLIVNRGTSLLVRTERGKPAARALARAGFRPPGHSPDRYGFELMRRLGAEHVNMRMSSRIHESQAPVGLVARRKRN